MDRKKEIETLLNSLKQNGYSRSKIETELNYSENYIDQQLSKGGNNKFLLALRRLHSTVLEKATDVEGLEIEGREGKGKGVQSLPRKDDISLQAIHNLTETGKIHAENQKVMVSNESRLITLLEATVGLTKDNSIASPAIMSGILVAMAKIGSGKKWHSEEEALRELGRMLSPQAAENKKKKNTQIDERK